MIFLHTDDDAVHWHVLASNLQPSSRCRAEINTAAGRFEEGVLFVELY